MDLRSKWVHFRIRDVYLPDPEKVLIELHGNDLLQGKVIDVSDNGASEREFVVVEVEGIEQPLIVPIQHILGVL